MTALALPFTRTQPAPPFIRAESLPQASRSNPFIGMQQRELAHCQASLRGEYFFFIADWPGRQIFETGGVERWLGYPERSFSAADFARAEHPGQAKIMAAFSESFIHFLNGGQLGQPDFLSHRLVVQQALRHRDGSARLFKHIHSPWQFDENRRVSACLHEFHFIDEYRGEPLRPRLLTRGNLPGEPFEIIRRQAAEALQKAMPFTRRHREILRLLAAGPHLTERQLADQLFISTGTVHVHSRLMLPLARGFFHQKFETLKQLTRWLADSGVLPVGATGGISEN